MKLSRIFAILSFVTASASFTQSQAQSGGTEKQKQNPSPADPPIPTTAVGQGLYEQNGANSCMYCHGISGEGGKVAAAAKLNHPKSWKSYKGLGGDAAYAKDSADFLKKLEEAVVNLIEKGAVAHNATFKPAHFDWKKTGGPINGQMLGVAGAPSTSWINKYKDRGMNKNIASHAVYNYIKKLDKEGVFK